jgi:hypothetical protein
MLNNPKTPGAHLDACATRRNKDRAELDKAINSFPESFVRRFGEICWARSGDRADWWPAEICDPRSFINNQAVVDLARRSIGRKHLVFFFEIPTSPFDALPESRILSWEEGVEKDLHTGRHVRGSKERIERFNNALMIAKTELATHPSQKTSSPAKAHINQNETSQRTPLKTHDIDDDVDDDDTDDDFYTSVNNTNSRERHMKQRRAISRDDEERARLLMAAPICRYYAPPLF